jgi:hypothetical protein
MKQNIPVPSAKKLESPEDKRKTITAFLLFFPSLIVGLMGIIASAQPLWFNFLIVVLEIYQWILVTQFINDFYFYRSRQ